MLYTIMVQDVSKSVDFGVFNQTKQNIHNICNECRSRPGILTHFNTLNK